MMNSRPLPMSLIPRSSPAWLTLLIYGDLPEETLRSAQPWGLGHADATTRVGSHWDVSNLVIFLVFYKCQFSGDIKGNPVGTLDPRGPNRAS